jgi:hypothetical protein
MVLVPLNKILKPRPQRLYKAQNCLWEYNKQWLKDKNITVSELDKKLPGIERSGKIDTE